MKNQKIIVVQNICRGTFTNVDGVSLYCAILNVLDTADDVVLSFSGIDAVSSSFLNSSIGNIIDEKGINLLKSKLKITNYTPSLADKIKKYIAEYSYQNNL